MFADCLSPVRRSRQGRLLALSFVAALVVGCAAPSAENQKRIDMTKGVRADAKPCCESLQSLLQRSEPLTVATARLDFETPHLDVGFGMAPLLVYRIDPRAAFIEAEAPLQLLGWAYGGDGQARHLDVKLQFVDDAGRVLSQGEPQREVRYRGNGYRALFYTASVPAGARSVVVTTDPKANGERISVPARNMPGTGMLAGGVPIFIPGSASSSFALCNYSPLRVSLLDAARAALPTP